MCTRHGLSAATLSLMCLKNYANGEILCKRLHSAPGYQKARELGLPSRPPTLMVSCVIPNTWASTVRADPDPVRKS